MGAGDVLMAASDTVGVALHITNSSFINSQTILGAACIQVIGNVSLGAEISSSTFQHSISFASAILVLAHYSGEIFLTDLTMSDINSRSTSLILIMSSTPTPWNLVDTTVERLKVFNCTFSRGIEVLGDNGNSSVIIHSNQFEGNNGTAVLVNAGNVSDWGSVYRANGGDFPLYYQKTGSTVFLHSVLFEGNYPSQTLGMMYLEGNTTTLSLFNCTFRSN